MEAGDKALNIEGAHISGKYWHRVALRHRPLKSLVDSVRRAVTGAFSSLIVVVSRSSTAAMLLISNAFCKFRRCLDVSSLASVSSKAPLSRKC